MIAPKRPTKDMSSTLSAFFTKNSYNNMETRVTQPHLNLNAIKDLLTSLVLLKEYKVAAAITRKSPFTGFLPPEKCHHNM